MECFKTDAVRRRLFREVRVLMRFQSGSMEYDRLLRWRWECYYIHHTFDENESVVIYTDYLMTVFQSSSVDFQRSVCYIMDENQIVDDVKEVVYLRSSRSRDEIFSILNGNVSRDSYHVRQSESDLSYDDLVRVLLREWERDNRHRDTKWNASRDVAVIWESLSSTWTIKCSSIVLITSSSPRYTS